MAKNIFLVEDEGLLREILTVTLREAGYEVETSENAEDCIFRLGQQSYDLLISDIILPGISGLELLAFAKEKLSFMPVIIMTASTDLSAAVEALRLGAADYLCKPFKDDELLLRISRCLEVSNLKNQLAKQKLLEKELRDCLLERDDARSALKVVLKRSEKVKEETEQNIASTIQALILPLVSELELSLVKRQPEITSCLEVIKRTLAEVTAPFARSITALDYSLTPREIQIANFIRMGKTSKEIAQLTKISYATVESHRNAIRKKLGIKNRKVSLGSFLLGMNQ